MLLPSMFGRFEINPEPSKEADRAMVGITKIDTGWAKAKHTCERTLEGALTCKGCANRKLPNLPTFKVGEPIIGEVVSVYALHEYTGSLEEAQRIHDAMVAHTERAVAA